VRWVGYGPEENTWENALELSQGAAEAITDFHDRHPDAVSSVSSGPRRLRRRRS
jgi:hypothetical protein